MLNSHPAIGAALACVACATAICAATNASATEIYMGAGVASPGSQAVSCSNPTVCRNPGNVSVKLSAGYLSQFSATDSIQIAQGMELMAYSVGHNKLVKYDIASTKAGSMKNTGLAASYLVQAGMGQAALTGKIGLAYSQGKLSTDAGKSSTKNALVPVVGLGIRYSLTGHWSLNADWDRLPAKYDDGQKNRVKLFSIGLSYRF
ncbi:outer membrane beta-barrel protein [Undibacterium terreum]|nr:outer membrane beta-barrel protein [Undibacterium terreum]